MLDEKLTFEQVSEFEAHLIAATPSQGSIGNEALRGRLGWSKYRYGYIRDRLVQSGLLIKGRGRGGSVLRGEVNLPPPSTLRIPERDLYDPIVATIASRWVLDHRIQEFVLDRMAQRGRRDTGGKWTRPDVALVSCSWFKFVPGIQVELNTFEIKTFDGLDVTAVYEALAHRRAAHYSYVVAYIPKPERQKLESLLDRLCLEAESHGIGLIVVAKPDEYETWDFEIEPSRNDPDPADLDHFIRTQADENFQNKVLGWCRTF